MKALPVSFMVFVPQRAYIQSALEKKSDWTLKLHQNDQTNGNAAIKSQRQTRQKDKPLTNEMLVLACVCIMTFSMPFKFEILPSADQYW